MVLTPISGPLIMRHRFLQVRYPMLARTNPLGFFFWLRLTTCVVAWAACLAPFSSSSAVAAERGRSEGMLIGVANPITDGVVSQIKNKIEDALRNRRRPK